MKDSGKREVLAGGCGKTTTMDHYSQPLATLLDPTSGEIALEIKIEIKSAAVERPP